MILGDPPKFAAGDRVVYVPMHAHGDRQHPDCEHGVVSSTNERYVFVRFERGGGRMTGPQPCEPDDLVAE